MRVDGLRPLLPVMLALWPAPETYTGQDVAEIHLVGSMPLLNLVLAHCLGRGARLAEPGEFTLRAFLSGRIDLTRAEAVLGVIEAAIQRSWTRPSSSLPGDYPGRSWPCAIICLTWWHIWKPTLILPTSPTSIPWAERPWPASSTRQPPRSTSLAGV